MQPLASGPKLTAYHQRLLSSHDFDITVDVLTLDEVAVGRAAFLDGQVNITSGELVRRNASITLSDPEGALDFSNDSAWEGASLWADRLVRVTHSLEVPGYGLVQCVPFIGPPTAISRQGSEVSVTCSDKAALATRGARARTARKGMLATVAIRDLMSKCTGEFRFRLPQSKRRLSKPYSVGLTDEASPMAVCAKIARAELGMQLLYSCDGYLMARPIPDSGAPAIDLGLVTEEPNVATDFSATVNFVRVYGETKSKEKGRRTTTTQPVSQVQLRPSSSMSPERLKRKGVERLLPLVVEDSALTTRKETGQRARRELSRASGIDTTVGVSVVPVFHLDADDVVRVRNADLETRVIRFSTGSFPLGVGGDMTVGFQRAVSSGKLARTKSRLLRTVKWEKKPKKRPKRKGGGRR